MAQTRWKLNLEGAGRGRLEFSNDGGESWVSVPGITSVSLTGEVMSVPTLAVRMICPGGIETHGSGELSVSVDLLPLSKGES